MSRFCERCGNQLDTDENFCPSCGAKVERDEPSAEVSPFVKTMSKISEVKTFARPKIFALIGGVVLVAIAGVILFMNFKPSDASLGGLYLGMSKQEADKKFGAGTVATYSGFFYGNVYVQFNEGGTIKSMYCGGDNPNASTNVSTGRGIHTGSTVDEVTAAYGTSYNLNDNGNPTFFGLEYKIENFTVYFVIDRFTRRVTGIGLYINP